MTLVFLFPGQSSRYPGMLDAVESIAPEAKNVLDRASAHLGRDLRHHYRADNERAYARNVDVQLSVFVANQMFLESLQAAGIDAPISLGLSLGEYSHLVHIGALGFEDALDLVNARGEAYDQGPRGMMASCQPIDLDELEAVVRQVQDFGLVEIVNLNSPRQHVIAGDAAAVEAAVRVLEDEHYVQPTIIERQVPMHASSFKPVGEALAPALAKAPFSAPELPYLPNRLGRLLPEATPERMRELLAAHVCSPVLWRASIDHVLELYPDATFVEVGPRAILHNLLQRKWVRNAKYHADAKEGRAGHFAALVQQLGDSTRPLAEVACSTR